MKCVQVHLLVKMNVSSLFYALVALPDGLVAVPDGLIALPDGLVALPDGFML